MNVNMKNNIDLKFLENECIKNKYKMNYNIKKIGCFYQEEEYYNLSMQIYDFNGYKIFDTSVNDLSIDKLFTQVVRKYNTNIFSDLISSENTSTNTNIYSSVNICT